jgi:putative Mg2+ transporter-C (MgtC) family protein
MNEMTILLQLAVSTILGGSIGLVRERDKKSAGLRTHILVCLGSTLIMILSIYMAYKFPGADAGRIAAQVVTGIGFIGAGSIIQAGGSVRGLTTAASIWISAAIGLAVGAGLYFASIISTIIALIVIELLREVEKKYLRGDDQ